MKTLPPITAKQKEILLLLYKFRFLNTHQFQTLLNHKNANGILAWLRDLKEKGYIYTNYSRKTFGENNKPAIHFLAPKARHILKDEECCSLQELNRVYKEKKKSEKFISHCLSLVDIYVFLDSQKEAEEELQFFTKAELGGYEYFPDPLPDAYISVKNREKTKRYFLDLFDEYTPPFVLRSRVKKYLEYAQEGNWEEATDNAALPSILYVCPNGARKKHIYYYTKSLLEKTFDDISFFLTTKDMITRSQNNNIWQKVE